MNKEMNKRISDSNPEDGKNISKTREIYSWCFLFQRLLDLSTDISFVLSSSFVIEYINGKVKQLGYLPRELKGQPIGRILRPSTQADIVNMLERLRSSVIAIKGTLVSNKGKNIEGTIKLQRIFTPSGERKYIGTIYISRRGANLRDLILDSINSGVIFLGANDLIIYANKYARDKLNLKLYNHISDLKPDFRKMLEIAQKATKEGKEIMQSMELTLSDGRIFGVSSYPFAPDGSVKGWVILFRDITETKRMQEAMAQIDKFANLGIIASGLAHEIKNPLAAMRLMIQAHENVEDSELRELFQKLKSQIGRIDRLVRQFVSYVKPSPPQSEEFNLIKLVNEIEGIVGTSLRQRNVQMVKIVPSNLKVWADYNQTHQILLNLILNAIDAVGEGGHIFIQAGLTNTRCRDVDRNCVYIIVKDDGPGIPPEALEKIFYPFYTTKKHGMGLGLFIVHQLVRQNHGFINVKSELGKGTSFTIMLPAGE